MEGVLFNLYHCYLLLTDQVGIPKKIKLSGGIINSAHWSQMCADIFGAEMEADASKHSSLMGAAALALERLGIINGLSDFTVTSESIIRPDSSKTKKYAQKYARYLEWYEKTK